MKLEDVTTRLSAYIKRITGAVMNFISTNLTSQLAWTNFLKDTAKSHQEEIDHLNSSIYIK